MIASCAYIRYRISAIPYHSAKKSKSTVGVNSTVNLARARSPGPGATTACTATSPPRSSVPPRTTCSSSPDPSPRESAQAIHPPAHSAIVPDSSHSAASSSTKTPNQIYPDRCSHRSRSNSSTESSPDPSPKTASPPPAIAPAPASAFALLKSKPSPAPLLSPPQLPMANFPPSGSTSRGPTTQTRTPPLPLPALPTSTTASPPSAPTSPSTAP